MNIIGYRKLLAFMVVIFIATALVVYSVIPSENWLTQIVVALGGLFGANLMERRIEK